MTGKFAVLGLFFAVAIAATVTMDRSPGFESQQIRTVTAPLSERECAAWRKQAEALDRRRPGWFSVYEGFARLQGICLAKDEARGRREIEAALAARLDEMLVIPYFEALANMGDRSEADRWAPLAVAAGSLFFDRTGRMYSQSPHYLRAFIDRKIGVHPVAEDWNIWYPRVRELLERPPLLPEVESVFLQTTINGLIRIRETEGYLLLDDARRAGRILNAPEHRDTAIALASRCGDPEALRRQAKYFLAGELDRPDGIEVAGRLHWLHARTGAEEETLSAVLAKLGRTADDLRLERNAGIFDEQVAAKCSAVSD